MSATEPERVRQRQWEIERAVIRYRLREIDRRKDYLDAQRAWLLNRIQELTRK